MAPPTRTSPVIHAPTTRQPRANYAASPCPSSRAKHRLLNTTTPYTARFGVPLVGSKGSVAVNRNIDGFQDVPVLFSAVVPAASQAMVPRCAKLPGCLRPA